MSKLRPNYEKCECVCFEWDGEEGEDYDVLNPNCSCGHTQDEHQPDDPKYPGDSSCKVEIAQ